jgi:hypothetical protein
MRQARNYAEAGSKQSFTLVYCSAYFSTLKMEATFAPKRQLTFAGLHGVLSQNTELFVITAVRKSNPTNGDLVEIITGTFLDVVYI